MANHLSNRDYWHREGLGWFYRWHYAFDNGREYGPYASFKAAVHASQAHAA